MRAHAAITATVLPSADGTRCTRISRLRSQAPLMLFLSRQPFPAAVCGWDGSKPGQRPASAGVSLAAGAAGPLGGDSLQLTIYVEAGATLMVKAVSATLLLPGPHGKESSTSIIVNVGPGGTLVWLPGLQIAAEHCRHTSLTDMNLESGARLYVREELILGRHGEPSGALTQRLRIKSAGRPLYDQELAVGPGADGWAGSAVVGRRRAIGTVITVDQDEGRIAALCAPEAVTGPDTAAMRVSDQCAVLSSLAFDAIGLRRQLDRAAIPTT